MILQQVMAYHQTKPTANDAEYDIVAEAEAITADAATLVAV